MYRRLLALIIVVIILWVWSTRTVPVNVGDRAYNVVGRYHNRDKAAKIFAELHKRMVKVMRHLKRKYVGFDSSIMTDLGDSAGSDELAKDDLRAITLSILRNYNPDVFYENDPAVSHETAYTLNKGATMYFCIRNKESNNEFCDFDILLFAMLHEVSHIGTYNDWGHKVRFWEVFKFILAEAAESGAYIPMDYSKSPRVYCGLEVGYNPLFDTTLRDIRKQN